MGNPVNIVRCISCDGYGWSEDEFDDGSVECQWCGGIGYVYQENGVDSRIPEADFEQVAEQLEALELERMREIGYSGTAKKPWQQDVRKGRNPLDGSIESKN